MRCDSEALRRNRLKLGGCERSLFGILGCDSVSAAASSSFKIGVVCDRCLGMLGVRSFKIRVVCDSEALRRNRCLGMLGCDLLKLRWLCAIAD